LSHLRQMQQDLARTLWVAAAGSAALGMLVHQPSWGFAAALGFLATLIYFRLLGRQVSKTLSVGSHPALVSVIFSLIGRQAVCLLACLISLEAWGMAWWACLGALLIGRHLVMVVSSRLSWAV